MKITVCVGDSHTWGEGATGVDGAFAPPAVGGDSRPVPFGPPNYVNLLRRELSGSFREVLPKDLSCEKQGEYTFFRSCSLPFCGSFGRVMLLYHPDGGTVEFLLDGEKLTETDTCFDPSVLPPARTAPRTHRFTDIRTVPGEHLLTVRSDRPVFFYRAEFYDCDRAVLNGGVGSCPTGLYLDAYWEMYVSRYQPDEVIINPMSINDWIVQTSIKDYERNITEMIRRTRAMNARPVLVTVAPITGSQYFGDSGIVYDDYIEATRRCAEREGVPLADVNRAISDERSRSCPDEESFFRLFCHDCWHPNDRGHAIYAEQILRARA